MEEQPIPYGFCYCGCGQKTALAPQTNKKFGWRKNEPMKFLKGHNARRMTTETREKLSLANSSRRHSEEQKARISIALRGQKRSNATRERMSKAQTKHGLTNSPERYTYNAIHQRCENANHISYPRYGARGIQVCARWSGPDGFLNFYNDVGPRPSSKHSIDRIDPEKDYCPENCRWATAKEQARNTTTTTFLDYCGERLSLADWADRVNINPETLRKRLKMGWSIDKAITTPVRRSSS